MNRNIDRRELKGLIDKEKFLVFHMEGMKKRLFRKEEIFLVCDFVITKTTVLTERITSFKRIENRNAGSLNG